MTGGRYELSGGRGTRKKGWRCLSSEGGRVPQTIGRRQQEGCIYGLTLGDEGGGLGKEGYRGMERRVALGGRGVFLLIIQISTTRGLRR
eukprot:766787-Hanusia_phi.AAC.1